ncbi:MAG: hypothetical protein H0X66_13315 [Verrucomicrobia bacterium]|nr:hypothetical protein [Verrucomicrobiota bacterium]
MNFKFLKVAPFVIGLLLIGSGLMQSQIPDNVSAKGVNLQYFDRTQLKAHFVAEAADPVPGGHIFAKEFQMFTFGTGGAEDIEVILKAPECFFDYDEKRAWSDGRLKAFNASTNYVIEGEGFVFQRTKIGATLEVSNKVHTTIHREAITERGTIAPPVHIYSDHLHFVSIEAEGPEKRIANYKRNVRVDDHEMLLTSGALRVAIPGGTNQVRNIVARENVRIRSKVDNSQATGDYAFYSSNPTNETIILSGNPVWSDAQNEGRAQQFIFDRKNKIVYGLTNAELKMPRSSMASADLIQSDTNDRKVVDTNEFVLVTADFFQIALVTTNRPFRRLIARTNVVITSLADQTRATAKTAVFNDATGVLNLRGDAVWQSDQTIARGDLLILNRTNRTFQAERNASLKLPANNTTNQFILISSEKYLLQTNVANFEGGVSAEFLDGKAPSLLTCKTLEIVMRSNQVETIIAKGNVGLTQTVSEGHSRSLLCEEMTIQRSIETGAIRTLFAERQVSLIEKDPKSDRKLTADFVTMNFGKTNQLDSLLAESNVRIDQGASWSTGQRALYLVKEGFELFEITGQPLARKSETTSDGKTSSYWIKEADVLRWNPKSGEFSAEGPFVIE